MFNRHKRARAGAPLLSPSDISNPIQPTPAQMSFSPAVATIAATPLLLPRTPSTSKIPVRTTTLRKSRRPQRPDSSSTISTCSISPAKKTGFASAAPITPTPSGDSKKKKQKDTAKGGHSKFTLWSNGSRTSLFHSSGVSDNEPKRSSEDGMWESYQPMELLSVSSGRRLSHNSHISLSPASSSYNSDNYNYSAMAAEISALKAENKKLGKEVVAERKFSATLVQVLKTFHEDSGRVNPAPGDIGGVYYRDLKDEHGEPLVPAGYSAGRLAGSGLESEWEDEAAVWEESRRRVYLGRDDSMATVRPRQVGRWKRATDEGI
ncbi:hypothetical protein L873DRAFT_1845953 [Choiromyces venosus 120613-1]|uniref:Uncharacterized protein n=1 Tax=Choiromyces venosus 120613-1 TaxID=1336337 RepID=A0A3N4JB96_9PEZI|nr:hypothetical protein L873DRAFT_1845953 [Choiromyces venosus 120613-1]